MGEKSCAYCQVPFCDTCDATKPTQCSKCIESRMLDINGQCVCVAGTELQGSTCTPVCSSYCATCFGGICDECKATTIVNGITVPTYRTRSLSGTCPCNIGYYDQNNNIVCVSCGVSCSSCSSTGVCLGCLVGSYLSSQKTCIKCGTGCINCNSYECLEC